MQAHAAPQLSSLPATLAKVVEEFPGTKSFFMKYDRDRFSFRASQVVRLSVKDSGENSLHHPFSIASSPTEELLQITTRIRPESPFKQTLNALRPGDALEITGPGGTFTLPETRDRPIVLLAGGIGITPMRGMIKFATDRELSQKITLLYSNRSSHEVLFKNEIDQLRDRNPNFKTVYTITREQGTVEGFHSGRMDASFVKKHVEDPETSLYYISGTPSFTTGMKAALVTLGIPDTQIRVEKFSGYFSMISP